MAHYYSFGRIPDSHVIKLGEALLDAFTAGTLQIWIGDRQIIEQTKTADSEEEEKDADALAEERAFRKQITNSTFFITRMTWTSGGKSHRVTYWRGKIRGLNQQGSEIWMPSSTPFVDSLEYDGSGPHFDTVLKALQKHVSMAPPITVGVDTEAALAQSTTILTRVSDAVATLVEHTAERQKDLDRTRTTLSREADQIVKARKAEVQRDMDAIKAAYDEKEAALLARERELDDRANTHVRREFAKQMANLSDTRLSANLLSRSSRSFLIPLGIALVPALLLVWLVINELRYITSFNENIANITKDRLFSPETRASLISNTNTQILYAQVRIGLQSLGIAALVWFALRLASSRYKLVSGWERDLHKFRLDTERAGFLVEGDLEARKVNDQGLPDVLLQSFAKGLFAGSETSHSDSRSEALGGTLNTLLGQAARVKFGPDGVNVEIEGKGLRRARKAIEDDTA